MVSTSWLWALTPWSGHPYRTEREQKDPKTQTTAAVRQRMATKRQFRSRQCQRRTAPKFTTLKNGLPSGEAHKNFRSAPAREFLEPQVLSALFPHFLAGENGAPAGKAKQLKTKQGFAS